jgi:hypothetical protein
MIAMIRNGIVLKRRLWTTRAGRRVDRESHTTRHFHRPHGLGQQPARKTLDIGGALRLSVARANLKEIGNPAASIPLT